LSTIAGPKVQVPTSLESILDSNGVVLPQWQAFFHSIQQTVYGATRSGPTASRPTNALDGRYIGMPYFDTTLGLAIYLKSVNPDVWVKGDGSAA
jgi:hypothetical protein